ncbi:MAG: COX15/CtaA family protein, partial [Aggregatilineales bacterium]
PLCDGTIIPPLDNVTAWIEWTHRLFAALIGLFGLAMWYAAWRAYRADKPTVLQTTIVAAALFLVQSILGAIVVVLELPPTFVTLHLGTAMLLLGTLLIAAVTSQYVPRFRKRDNVSWMIYINAAFSLLIILTGALVRGSGATLACGKNWPLCIDNTILPVEIGQLALIHMVHRFAVAALGITLLLLLWQIIQRRGNVMMRNITILTVLVYFMQAGVGAMYVFSVAGPEWGAAHVGMAAMTWGLLVILSTIEAMDTGEFTISENQNETEWQLQEA